jgi:Cu+-exporting ATPase
MGAQFYTNAYKALKHHSTNMDVLVMLGTTSAWLYAIVLIGVGYSTSDMQPIDMYEMTIL